jgi:ribonuclease P protein component
MLPKNKRLTTAIQKKVFEKGRSVFGPTVSLVYINEDPTLPSRFGFSLSKKSVKTAPKRNVIKRKGFEAVRKLLKNINSGYCAVFVIKKDISKEPLTFFLKTIEDLIEKSPLFKK